MVLQQIVIGHFISILAMAAAALLEIKHLSIVKAVHLEHQKVAVLPASSGRDLSMS